MGRHLRLSTQTLLLQFGVVVLALLVGTAAWTSLSRAALQEQYGERALAIADSVAALPTVAEALADGDPGGTLQPLGEAVREAAAMSFVVITDREGRRYSHPDPSRLGERVSTDPGAALDGERVIEVDTGTLGRSVRGKVPIVQDDEIVGMVSVGVLMEHVMDDFLGNVVPAALLFLLPAMALGVVGSLLLGRRFKRLTFGLEPHEIAGLLEQRQAMLHGIREGVVGLDRDGRIVVANDEARRLFPFTGDPSHAPPAEVLPSGPLRELLAGTDRADDVAVIEGGRVLVASRMPVALRDERVGTVVTVRDRTQLETLSRELDSLRDVADALRAQAHEFDNHLHTLAGLIELGRHDEALAMITETAVDHQQLSDSLTDRLHDPMLVALLLTKATVAAERDVVLTVSEDSWVDHEFGDPKPLLTVVGNLIDNAIDAAADPGAHARTVEVSFEVEGERLWIRVADRGPGIDTTATEKVFRRGYSTKAPLGEDRGLGLALVSQVVTRLGGQIDVRGDDGAVFTVRIPIAGLQPSARDVVSP
ncbi:ATP-binding protein [Nitriliruptor alkaliphilus]|uniref:ATP-binding protein n=1 Tax=Nitriliruptor alkaliphilus TaxID=427918 RepID=UPI000696CCAD|nr:sensor histidine kinase [Nitriliruptor alkaliphilus]